MSNEAAALSTLEVHLDRVARNYLYLRKKLKAGADCAAVVKADAYGLGAAEVAPALYAQECRHFFVAHASEAEVVASVLPAPGAPDSAVIYVLNGPHGLSAADWQQKGFIPVLNTLGDIEYWADSAAKAGKRLPCIIHIDTGMNRLGLTTREVSQLAERRAALLQNLDVRYVMSHLACADEPQHALNAQQLATFRQLTGAVGQAFRYSFANSAGIFLGDDYHFDLARPGCALYGIQPYEGDANPMHGTVTLKVKIVQARAIDAPGTVGYGAGYAVKSGDNLATISIGYADGYLRSATGKGKVFVNGEACPVVGRVSMDSVVISTGHLKQPVTAGDYAEIIGPHQTVDEVAAQAGTIGYEILTSLGKRYKRIYTGI